MALLKMSELVERSGVGPATIKHYLREGLLPEPVRTSRNMAYYPVESVARLALIKRLQEERFMPLRLIRRMLECEPERLSALLELEDRIVEQALRDSQEQARLPAATVAERYDVPAAALERLAELGVLTPSRDGYDPDDVKLIEAIGRFRAGGYEALGFTVYDTLRYREALEPLVAKEVSALLERLARGEVDPDRAVEIVSAGAEPLRELVGAMHSKLLLAELRRQRAHTRAST